jgi:homospermidine synthase
MLEFRNKVLFVGYGAVAQCALPILVKHIKVPARDITVMDFEDRRAALAPWLKRGVTFVRKCVTPDNMDALLGKYLEAGDLLIDLAWNIDCCEILQWCHDRGVLYVNTSVELWDPYENAKGASPQKMTLYWRQMNLRRMIAKWDQPGPTAVIEHGANPGLISHFTKQGLLGHRPPGHQGREGQGQGHRRGPPAYRRAEVQSPGHGAWREGDSLQRARHANHRPAETGGRIRQHLEYRGFPRGRHDHGGDGLGHAREGAAARWPTSTPTGRKTRSAWRGWESTPGSSSWVPNYCIHGMVVRHGEAFTISDRLTVWEKGNAIYRPTVHYAYCPSDAAIASLNELRGNDFELAKKQRILNDDITSGSDILGALLMGHPYGAWWTGQRPEHRGVAPARAAPERHHRASGHLRRSRLRCG